MPHSASGDDIGSEKPFMGPRSIFFKIFIGFSLVTLISSSSVFLASLFEQSITTSRHTEELAEERRRLMAQSLGVYARMATDILRSENPEAVARYSQTIARTAGIRPHFFFGNDSTPTPTDAPQEVSDLARKAWASQSTEYTFHRDVFVLAQPVQDETGRRMVVVGETQLDETGLAAPSASRPRPSRPSREAEDACFGKKSGDPVTYPSPQGPISGVCAELPPDGTLAAVPADGRPPESRPREGGPPGPGGSARPTVMPPTGSLWAKLATSGQLPNVLLLFFLVLLVSGLIVCFWLTRHLTAPLIKLGQAARRMTEGDLTVRVGNTVSGRGDEIASLGRDFDRMAEHIQQLVGLHHRLLRDVAHELRSPLARLNLALELASKSDALEKLPSSLNRIRRESDRLNTLIGQLLLLARMEHSTEMYHVDDVLLDKILDEIIQDVNFEAEGNSRRVIGFVGIPVIVPGNQELLRQALENIVRNAARYTLEGSAVEVSLELPEPSENRQARIRVRDHGPGVPNECLPHIFRAFYRVSESREPGSGGFGVGLAIAERVINLHGGTIQAYNEPSGGLVVEVTLPLKQV